MFHSIGPLEIGLIVLVILIVFGVGRLPQVGGAIGKGIREFRQSLKGENPDEKPEVMKSEETKSKETSVDKP